MSEPGLAPSRQRAFVLRAVACSIPPSRRGSNLRVAVDGPDGSGKTIFADELAAVLRDAGRPVVRISLDDFHNVRALRYRQGRDSPEGFWRDSFDYERFTSDVLRPFGPDGSRRYRVACHDLASDEVLAPEPRTAPPGAVLVVDGLFLHRDELVGTWDHSVFLDAPFAVTARRMAQRDGTHPDPDHPTMRRYVEAHRIYLAACSPRDRAAIVVDNTEVDAPRILEQRSVRACAD